MADFSDAENKALVEFRNKVQDVLSDSYMKSDDYLIRWLRARDLNMELAEGMLRNHMKWRQENKIDAVLVSMPDQYFTKHFPHWMNGVDIHGSPVACVPMGEWDVRKVVDDKKIPDFETFINRFFERICENIRRANEGRQPGQKPIRGFTCIVNWDGFSPKQTANAKAVQTILGIISVYEAHFPEILGQAFFINTNPVFQILFALMKPIFAAKTLTKISCYGTNRKEWEPVVRAVVEEHQIPRQFGG